MIGDNIKSIRQSKKISQKEFAKMLGIPVSTLANYENNHREPKIEILKKIASTLGVSTNELTTDNSFLTTGYNIKSFRENNKLSIDNLSKKTGISSNELIAIEEGIKKPSMDQIILIAYTLETSPVFLLANEDLQEFMSIKIKENRKTSTLKETFDVDDESSVLYFFNKLNNIGKEKVISYAKDLSENIKYRE